MIESSKSFPDQEWEAVIWHNGHLQGEWAGLELEEVDAPEAFSVSLLCSSMQMPKIMSAIVSYDRLMEIARDTLETETDTQMIRES